jgi:hypothetical protein
MLCQITQCVVDIVSCLDQFYLQRTKGREENTRPSDLRLVVRKIDGLTKLSMRKIGELKSESRFCLINL